MPAPEAHCSQRFDFDRILCDVPCSGDGTLRKVPSIWKRWVAAQGNQLHTLQVQLAAKAVRLLRVGGRLVYSTCSLNPVENEVCSFPSPTRLSLLTPLAGQSDGVSHLTGTNSYPPCTEHHPS
jgi:16S rRNA C967 or C1407 C5-methylase (RsmB/RsmF family)